MSYGPDVSLPGGVELIFILTLSLLLIVGVVVFIVVSSVRSRRVLQEAGLEPLVAQQKTLEQRLSDLEDLRARGVLSESEYAASRAAVLIQS